MGSDPGGESWETSWRIRQSLRNENIFSISAAPLCGGGRGWGSQKGNQAPLGPGLCGFSLSARLVLSRESDSWYHVQKGHLYLILGLQKSFSCTLSLDKSCFSWLVWAEVISGGMSLDKKCRGHGLRDPACLDLKSWEYPTFTGCSDISMWSFLTEVMCIVAKIQECVRWVRSYKPSCIF